MTHARAPRNGNGVIVRMIWAVCLLAMQLGSAHAAQLVIDGPVGSGAFGFVTVLPNGNIVVLDPGFDAPGPIANVGAVYLYKPTGVLISSLRGSRELDNIGFGGVVVLANGNFVVLSPRWDHGALTDAGAVTFVSGSAGLSGVVSPSNSLVGASANDAVGADALSRPTVLALPNGNYVVGTQGWDHGSIADAGAVTFGSGVAGVSGSVSMANSLVGSGAFDRIGMRQFGEVFGIIPLANSNYVVESPEWDNGTAADAGAVTFGSGTVGISGVVAPANSLVGTSAGDQVGSLVTPLSNGNYVASSTVWRNGAAFQAGAATFGSGTAGITGPVSPNNSLVGSTSQDRVGRVTALTNGNYVVSSPVWDNGTVADVGAVTFGSGTSGVAGAVSVANSLVGSAANDQVGNAGLIALTNGNYVVRSSAWSENGAVNRGAVTFGSGTSGISGPVSQVNSLVGVPGEGGLVALSNGNYVVISSEWSNGAALRVGAVTFGSGVSGISGVVSQANSLVGSTQSDRVGSAGVTALTNGNYVVASPGWDDGTVANVGAATFGLGGSGTVGVVSSANSLVGDKTSDLVGGFVVALSDGNYVVSSQTWGNATAQFAGAVTFGSGVSGISGVVSPANSLVGSAVNDRVGFRALALPAGGYVVISPAWANGGIEEAGAMTLGPAVSGVSGVVSSGNSLVGSSAFDKIGLIEVTALGDGNFAARNIFWRNGGLFEAGAVSLGLSDGSVIGSVRDSNSVLGLAANEGQFQQFGYDPARTQLVVGQYSQNRVVLHRPGIATSIIVLGGSPDPSVSRQPVSFTASVSATPDAPSNGQVTFTASSGESCVDTTPSATSATTAEFSCTMTIVAVGNSTVVAEYTGSVIHAYSGSAPETHTTIADLMFGDGFESP